MSGQGPRRTRQRDYDKLVAYQVYMELPQAERTHQAVADILDIPRTTARHRIEAAHQMFQDSVQRMRERVFLDTLDVQEAMRRKAIGGLNEATGEVAEPDHNAANAYLKANEQTRKLFGLDAPIKTDVTSDGDKITIQVVQDWQAAQDAE